MKATEPAAVWWRVSTDDQREISSETQIHEAKAMAAEEGYTVPDEYVLGTDWHSLSVWDSPSMEKLKDLIRSEQVQAVFMYEPDRSPSKPAHRLLFRTLCEEHGVRMKAKYGQVPEGDMGEVMEFLSAWSKEKQVLRAQQGARDGLRDRAKLRGLPTTSHPPYGYSWSGSRFEQDPATAATAMGIWQMALDGVSLNKIAESLTDRGIPTPTGREIWYTSTLVNILSNPIYKGEYVALRTQKVEPKTRRGFTYGKSTHRPRDPGEHIPLSGIVDRAYVSPEDFERVQMRLARNKAEGGKSVQRYLLRGMLRCESCGRRWRGKVERYRDTIYYRYVCGGMGKKYASIRCSVKSIKGPELERRAWGRVVEFLENPDVFLTAVEQQTKGSRQSMDMVKSTIKRLEKRVASLDAADTRAFSAYSRGIVLEQTYMRTTAELRAERTWVGEELDRQKQALKDAEFILSNSENIRRLYPLMLDRITSATFEDKLFVLKCLDTQVTTGLSGIVLSLAVPGKALESLDSVNTTPGRVGREEPRYICWGRRLVTMERDARN